MTTKIDPAEQAKNLEAFFNDSINMTTRERIFFNRLSFDLKIAAARADYHLHLYEPDVDRDGFDIFMEDAEGGKIWVQTKAVLSSVGTSNWATFAEFLRPQIEYMDKYRLSPMDCGRGGGIILIEIDASTADGNVGYYYTDYRVLNALAARFIIKEPKTRQGPGRPPNPVQSVAARLLREIRDGERTTEISVPRSVFLKVKEPDGLLALMGLWNSSDYGPFAIQNAVEKNVQINSDGEYVPAAGDDSIVVSTLAMNMVAMCNLLSSSEQFSAFKSMKT